MKRIDRTLVLVIAGLTVWQAGVREAAACLFPKPPPPPPPVWDLSMPPDLTMSGPPPCVLLCPDKSQCIFIYEGTVSQPTQPPNLINCVDARTVPADYEVTRSALIDDAGEAIVGFAGFRPNAETTAAFEDLAAAPEGQTWVGFSSPVGDIPVGDPGNLAFTVKTSAPPINYKTLNDNGWLGVAQSDLSGGNFDPHHQTVMAIPQGCYLCAGGIIPGDETMNPPLCLAGQRAQRLGILAAGGTEVPIPIPAASTAGCSVDHRGAYGGGAALLLAGIGVLIVARRRRRNS